MDATSHARAKDLMARRVVGAVVAPPDAQWLLEHLSTCPDCMGRYDRAQGAVAVMTGMKANDPAGITSRRLMEDTFARLAAKQPRTRPTWWRLGLNRWAAASLALTVVLTTVWVITGPWNESPGRRPQLLSRGGQQQLPAVGFGISGIDEEGDEYEVVESDGVCVSHALRFYVTAREPNFTHYLIFGVQGEEVHWYFPTPEEGLSYKMPEGPGERVAHLVPYEIELWKKHRIGTVQLVGLFSDRPLAQAAIQDHLERLRNEKSGAGRSTLGARIGATLGSGVQSVQAAVEIIDCGGSE